ncbi:von Willebrand factor A domain-containing protein 7-like [Scylla paramamosain]|uniref:von Willebrand factor A domain-containing protein 7-like n=1 Tax=Scylla paramamosain TaxID=85552 RepID=UPI0030838C80
MLHNTLLAANVLLTVVVSATAFLATPLNTTDPDLASILCPEQTAEVTRDHKWITREAIRRNIRRFFLHNPPPTQPGFTVPTDASLSQLYHAYYGASASPARFINAVNSIAASNVRADSARQLRYDPGIQADGEAFGDLQSKLSSRYPQLLTSILVNEAYSAARSLLGLSLHSIQKFYAHSTWIEAGNTDILPDLGLPGSPPLDVAAPDDDVCTPCPNSQGQCVGNVLNGVGLSTGFYQYTDEDAKGFLIPKPSSGGKCSHGGVLDETADQPARGGINKDTASPCFSPHHHLHQQAAELAVLATDHYLDVVLEAVGSDKYRRLFDLYQGSALSILIDTTSSMSGEINAVRDQVAEIVASVPTELYILVPYNDPKVGPVTKTDNPDDFLNAVNSLKPHGGDDIPEMYWQGLQLALSNTPDYGNIFSFTDAGGKDGNIMESVISLAQERNIKVTVVYSGRVSKDDPNSARKKTGDSRLITNQADYKRLADSTGGLFIPSGKFEIDAITPILGDSVKSVDVDIAMLKDVKGSQQLELPIDDSVLDVTVHLAGYMNDAVMQDVTGTTYDLLDDAALTAAGVEVVTSSEALRVVRFPHPGFGSWVLDLDADTSFSVTISANSTLSWLGGFSILDPSPPHPHYRAVEGNPLTDTVYYLDVMLIGYLESNLLDVDSVEYTDNTGVLLRTIIYDGDIDDEFYIRSEPLPEQPFNVRLCGHVQSGNKFCRLLPVLITPVQASVEVLATSEELSARPSESTSGDFLIKNFGLESDFQVTVTDDMKYFTEVTPSTIHLTSNGSEVVTASFSVPSGSVPGTVSTIILTAQSAKQKQSVNSAVTQLVVLPETVDTEAPLCSLDTEPDCSGFNIIGICNQKNWTITATLQDSVSGLSNAYAVPEGLWSEVNGLTPSTKNEVTLSYGASCCTSQVEIIGVDTVGNVGKCRIDMGVLGGAIVDLEAESVGVDWVMLRWSLSPTTLELHKYSLLINEDMVSEFRCTESVCHRNVTDLKACSLQTFQLTPYFYMGESDRVGLAAYTDATTLDLEPGSPVNGKQINSTSTTARVTWEAANTLCLHQYQVCYRPYGFPGTEVCEATSATEYELRGIEPCAVYVVTVMSVSPSGLLSEPLKFYVNTDEADPEAPRNVVLEQATETTVTLAWDDPLHHVQCIDRYMITYGVIEPTHREVHVDFSHNVATVSELLPCTNYSFMVTAVSKTGKMGPGAHRTAETLETENPNPVDALVAEANATTSLQVSWMTDMVCIDHFVVCYYEHLVPEETCAAEDNTETSLLGLQPCTDYTVVVTAVTPYGVESNKTTTTASTLEINPGKPEKLTVTDQTAHTVEISFDPPSVGSQCITEYDIQGILLDSTLRDKQIGTAVPTEPSRESLFTDLMACSEYEIRVRSVTRGLLTSDWVSVVATTLEDTPSAPRNLKLLDATQTTLHVQWWEPMDNYLCVEEYVVSWIKKGEAKTQTFTSRNNKGPRSPVSDMTLPNLTPCSQYDVTVKAVTPSGQESDVASLSADTTGCPP